ncbi:MAG TPA: monovalent cation/H+ antiporter subunit D family protein, partial [Gammaproteobacteria bacterium]|nr:monovalent cation/H+ antiporter subunit D family protein [Gammaproteobacteria bacterium]
RVVEVAYFGEVTEKELSRHDKIREVPLSMLVPLWILVIANLYFGIDAELTSEVARQAAKSLLGIN